MTIAAKTTKATVTATFAAFSMLASATVASADGAVAYGTVQTAPAMVASGCKVHPCPTSYPKVTTGKPRSVAAPVTGGTFGVGSGHEAEMINWPWKRNGCVRKGWGSVKCPTWK